MPIQKKRKITAEDLYAFEALNQVRFAPNGTAAVYQLQRVDRKTEKKYSNLWLAPLDGEPTQFTVGDQNDTSPRWSPDGKTIAFLSNRGNKERPSQIYLIPTHGGEARPLTEFRGQIGGFFWSPDGKKLLLMARKSDPEVIEREEDEQKKKLGVVSRHYNRPFYKLDGYGYLPLERWHLWLVDVASRKMTQLTDHEVFDEQYPCWTPDGKAVVFLSNRAASPDLNPDAIDIFVLPVQSKEARKIETPVGEKSMPSVSPDGRWVAYFGCEGQGVGYKNIDLWVVPLDGSASPRNLTASYDLNAEASIINDAGEAEQMPPTWSGDSQRLYFQVGHHGSVVLKSICLDGSELRDVIGEGGAVGSYTFDASQQTLVYFYGKLDDPGQVYVRSMKDGKTRPLTQVNRKLLDKIDLGTVEEVWYQAANGSDLQGWILKPPDFDPHQQYPSILEVHGGPQTQYGKFFMHEFYYLAAQGYVVYFTNPRGGRGYGEAHTKAIWGSWGGADYADLMKWVDLLETRPYIDRSRMGVTGGSYGGYMTVWMIGHTQRFKAAVTQRCVSNFISLWGSSDFNWAFQQTLEARQPFFDLEKFWEMSPMKYIGAAKTPTLVIHNEGDLRCPIEQSEQVFVALQTLGVDSEFVRFPDEFHGLSRTGRTDRRIVRLNSILGWFEKYLKN